MLKWIKSLFTTPTYQDSVEYYVVSKQPKSTAGMSPDDIAKMNWED